MATIWGVSAPYLMCRGRWPVSRAARLPVPAEGVRPSADRSAIAACLSPIANQLCGPLSYIGQLHPLMKRCRRRILLCSQGENCCSEDRPIDIKYFLSIILIAVCRSQVRPSLVVIDPALEWSERDNLCISCLLLRALSNLGELT